jgi:hypothetical protein
MMGDVRGNDETPAMDVEFLDVGGQGGPNGAGDSGAGDSGARDSRARRWPRWLLLLLVALAVLSVIARITHEDSKPSASPSHPLVSSRRDTSAPDTASAQHRTGRPDAAVVVTRLGHPILGVKASWELLGWGDRAVVRIQLARGRITRTTVPALQSGGPVSFLLGPNAAFVRPIDYVAGYVVPNGKPAREIPARLSLGRGGAAFPGPDPNHVWVQTMSGPPALVLTPLDRSGAGARIPIPPGSSALAAVPDGAGYLLFAAAGGVYGARPDGLHRITTGSLLAVGPSAWLTRTCDSHPHCVTVLIDQATKRRRVVDATVAGSGGGPGVIAPDGKTAALHTIDPNSHTTRVYLLDLDTGARHPLRLSVDQASDAATLAWSPDSRWLFAVDAHGQLDAVDPRTGQVMSSGGAGITLPPLNQLAIRTVPTK